MTNEKNISLNTMRKLQDKLGEDLEISYIEGLSSGDIDKELKKIGVDHKPIVKRIIKKLDLTKSTETVDKTSVKAVRYLLRFIGFKNNLISSSAAWVILRLWYLNNDVVIRCLSELTSNYISFGDKEEVLYRVNEPTIRAYRSFEETVLPQEGIKWLKRKETKLSPLTLGPSRRIYVAKVDPGGKKFRASWFTLGPHDHVLLVDKSIHGINFQEAVFHELEHLINTTFPSSTWRMETMPEHVNKLTVDSSYASAQKNVDPQDKVKVAKVGS